MSADLVLPLGRQLSVSRGRPGPDGEPDRDDVVAWVDRGGETVRLGGPAFTLWSACHGAPTAADDARWTLADARGLCLTWGATAEQTDRGWAELVATGTVGTLPDDPTARRDWAGAHLLVPTVLGLGNTADEPEVFAVGLPGHPVATMPAPLFEVWWAGRGFADLAAVVDWSADRAAAAGGTDTAAIDRDLLLAAVVGELHRLLTVRAAHLDVVVAG